MLQCDSTGSIPIRACSCLWKLTSNGINIIKNELAGLRKEARAGWEWCLERGLVVVRKLTDEPSGIGLGEAFLPFGIRMVRGFCWVFWYGGWFFNRCGSHSVLLVLLPWVSRTVGGLVPPVKFRVSVIPRVPITACELGWKCRISTRSHAKRVSVSHMVLLVLAWSTSCIVSGETFINTRV